jgi:tetratricopeptide (TPR) repeat protein
MLSELVSENETQKQQFQELQIALLSNIALGHLRKQEWKYVRVATEKVLELDPKNVKALFRQAKALNAEGSHQKAKELLLKASQIASSTEIQNELQLTNQLLDKQHNKEKKIYSNIFSKLQEEKGLYHVHFLHK